MAVGLAPAVANAILDRLCRNQAWTAPTALWLKWHVGDPGAAGSANPAANTTRIQATFGSAAAGGLISNTALIQVASAPNAEDYSHYSAWDASAAGAFQFSGVITANAVAVADVFEIPIGDLDVSLNVAA